MGVCPTCGAEDDGYDDRWLCDGCGGVWSDPVDDLTVGVRYRCVGCGAITVATSPRPESWFKP